MRQRIEQKQKADRPPVIRTGVWLTVFGLVLVCLLTISLSQRHASRPTTEAPWEDGADQDSSNEPLVRVQRTVNLKFTLNDYENGSDYDNEDALWFMVEQMAQDRR